MKQIAILGSTGSVGRDALAVAKELNGYCSIYCIAANTNWRLLLEQINEYKPVKAVVIDKSAYNELKRSLSSSNKATELLCGVDAVKDIITSKEVDIVLSAVAGASGLPFSIATLKAGKRLALANKESLVIAGGLLTQLANKHNGEIIPIDSEHSALFQAIRRGSKNEVKKIFLTASGGPFRKY